MHAFMTNELLLYDILYFLMFAKNFITVTLTDEVRKVPLSVKIF